MPDWIGVLINVAIVITLWLVIRTVRNLLREVADDPNRVMRCALCKDQVRAWDTCAGCGIYLCRECRWKTATSDVEMVEGHTWQDHKGVRL